MPFHLSHIHDYERFLAVDIGSYRVRSGIYSIESLEPKCIGFSSVRQNRKSVIGSSIADLRSVSIATERAMIQSAQKIESIPRDAIVGFSTSQCISDRILTQYIRKTRDPITMQEIDTIVKKVERSSFDRVRERARTDLGITHDDLKLVSSTITMIEIDGKEVTNPIGFTGERIRLSILNVFAPASEFNIIRSIASHTGKNIISLIPIPLVFPKILEKKDRIHGTSCILDVGLSHTTVICIENGSVIAVETFPFGTMMLLEALEQSHPELNPLQIEYMITHDEYTEARALSVEAFFTYLIDVIDGSITDHDLDFSFDTLYCHGGIFESEDLWGIFQTMIRQLAPSRIRTERFSRLLDCDVDQVVTHGLAEIATELLSVKKDPLVRLLRYVLYHYE